MAEGVPARLTPAAGRKFGLTLGIAFGVIGALLYWRGKHTRAMVAFTISGLFLLAGVAIPTHLGPVERAWMGLAHMISKVTTPIFMSIVYFLVLTPTGFLRRMGGNSMLVPKPGASRWEPHSPAVSVPESMERQF